MIQCVIIVRSRVFHHFNLTLTLYLQKFKYATVSTDAGLPYFDRAAVKVNGNWYYASALESIRAKLCFRYHSVNKMVLATNSN